MALLIILGVVVVTTFGVLVFLFLMLDKEGKKKEENVVPLTDLSQIKQELSDVSQVAVPLATPVTLPVQASQYVAGEDVYKKRAQELEEELLGISKKAEAQSVEAQQMIEDLTKENESLKIQQANLIQAKEKLSALQTETDLLHTENSSLQGQLESTQVKLRFLEEEMTAVKLQMGDEITRANATVSELKLENESLVSSSKKGEEDVLKQELEALKTEQMQLKQSFSELEETNKKLREANVDLAGKVDALQYELVKARAQTTGLERIGFNYKNQLEDFLKKVNSDRMSVL
jgi:DNA repair exonuclease SbcCD ATPase subunit